MSPVLPFVMVIVKQLGVPVVVQGTIGFAALMLTIFVKVSLVVCTVFNEFSQLRIKILKVFK